jgi:hypothetical protein
VIKELEGPKNFDLRRYAIGKLAQEINTKLCAHFHSERIYYFLESCKARKTLFNGKEVCVCVTHRIIWHGIGIIGFINRAISLSIKEKNAPVLFVTPLNSKNKIQQLRDVHSSSWQEEDRAYNAMRDYAVYEKAYDIIHYQRLHEEYKRRYDLCEQAEQDLCKAEYWLGDVSSDGYMICCDPLWGYLWDELRKQH